jgi:Fur family transcriptional regulator, ferric uptake regulator
VPSATPDSTSTVQAPLRKHGIRLTRQRELLFELIHNSHRHLNADQLYEMAKKRDAKINRVTVYRTLKILKQEGLVDELDLLHIEGDQHYYETRLKREHAHVVCLRCGSVQEYFGEPLAEMKSQIERSFGFKIELARTEIGGYCADCQSVEMVNDKRAPEADDEIESGVAAD